MELAVVVVTEVHHIASTVVEPILREGVICATAAPILETIQMISNDTLGQEFGNTYGNQALDDVP